MPGTDDLYPPAQYGGGWFVLALGILILLIVGGWAVAFFTRPKRSPTIARLSDSTAIQPQDVLQQLRTEYLQRIRDVEDDYRNRALTARRANLELSRLVRAFVNEYSGLEAPVLALEDLVARGVHPALLDAIGRHYYPSIFRREPAVDPVAGAEAARTVVHAWH